jgi:hypothetical protein
VQVTGRANAASGVARHPAVHYRQCRDAAILVDRGHDHELSLSSSIRLCRRHRASASGLCHLHYRQRQVLHLVTANTAHCCGAKLCASTGQHQLAGNCCLDASPTASPSPFSLAWPTPHASAHHGHTVAVHWACHRGPAQAVMGHMALCNSTRPSGWLQQCELGLCTDSANGQGFI